MVRRPNQFIWAVAACAAVAVQAVPRICCGGCDQPCCDGQTRTRGQEFAEVQGSPASGCPLCAAAAGEAHHAPSDTYGEPCGCQLSSRHDQPLAPTKAGWLTSLDDAMPGRVASATPPAPQVIGVSREYLAASLAVPIRPSRILFGVWRN